MKTLYKHQNTLRKLAHAIYRDLKIKKKKKKKNENIQ